MCDTTGAESIAMPEPAKNQGADEGIDRLNDIEMECGEQHGMDEVRSPKRQAAALQRLLCRRDGQRGGGFFLRTPVAGADAGAGGDPLVAGVHGAAQLFICDRAAGQGLSLIHI